MSIPNSHAAVIVAGITVGVTVIEETISALRRRALLSLRRNILGFSLGRGLSAFVCNDSANQHSTKYAQNDRSSIASPVTIRVTLKAMRLRIRSSESEGHQGASNLIHFRLLCGRYKGELSFVKCLFVVDGSTCSVYKECIDTVDNIVQPNIGG